MPNGDYAAFIDAYFKEQGVDSGARRGEIVTREGEVLGEHEGLAAYTVGQRRGLGLSTGRTLYVTQLDPARNTVVVGEAREVEVDTLVAEQVNWISIGGLDGPLDVLAQIRHRHTPARATIRPSERGVEVRFDAPQWAPAPGQSVVFYQGDMVVGGGVIGAGRAEAA